MLNLLLGSCKREHALKKVLAVRCLGWRLIVIDELFLHGPLLNPAQAFAIELVEILRMTDDANGKDDAIY